MMAVPARPGLLKMVQKDGTVLMVRLVGDEHMSYFVNEDSGQKMYRAEDGDLKPLTEQRFAEMKKYAAERRADAEKARAVRQAARGPVARQGVSRNVGEISGGMIGSKKGLVILVNFQDKSFTKTQQNFDDQFNKVGYNSNYHVGSVHDYFYDQSYQQFDLSFDVVGPVTVSKNMAYYGAHKGNNNDSYPATMVREACVLVKDLVDFKDYDWDNDGYVDQVFVIYAGYGEAQGASSNTIWPHEWNLSSASYYGDGQGRLYQDGVYIDTYACSCELSGKSGSTMDGIGTACHEFSHCLGYPDLYDTDYSGGWGMDHWDLMCSGSYNGPNGRGETPAGYTSFERWLAGWLEPVELKEGKSVTGMKPLNNNPEAYIIYNDKNSNEFIMLENRKNDKWFKYVGTKTNAYGLLAIHVDYNASIWAQNKPNDDPEHQRVTIIPAGKQYDSNYSRHPFPGSYNVASLTATSHSSAGGKWWTKCSTGSTALNHELTEISYKSTDNTVSFLFDGGDATDDGKRYTITYVVGSGTCVTESWKQTEWREEAVLPEAVGERPGYTFIGWSTTDVAKTTQKPTVIAAGTKLQPEEDMTLYAVYQYLYSPSPELAFRYTTTVNVDKDYLFVSGNEEGEAYAIDYSTAAGTSDGKGSSVQIREVGGNLVINNPASTSVWSCTYSSGANQRRLMNSDSYLAISSTGMSVTTGSNNVLWSSNYGLYGMSGVSKYYVHPEDNGTFSVDKQSGNPVYAFEMMGERPTTYYSNTFSYYTLTYLLDSVQYKQRILEAGSDIIPLDSPEEREGYSFSGWQNQPAVMPAHDVEVYGSYTINSYLLTYFVDSLIYQQDSVLYGDSIILIAAPEAREGFIFSGWQTDVPEVMPAHDVEIHGYFEEDEASSITSVRKPDAAHSIYTLQGVRLKQSATEEDLRQLPSGIYLIDGKKYIVR